MQGAMTLKIVAPPGTEFIKHYHIYIYIYISLKVTAHYWESESSYIFILQKNCVTIVLFFSGAISLSSINSQIF